jgi:FecR protein
VNYSGKFDANFSADVSSPHSFGHFNVDTVRASHVPSDAIIVPNAHLLFNGDYKKSGLDLVLSKDGQELVLHDYFKGENRAPLASPDGAHLTGDLVNALSGHVQYAQADGSAAAAKVIGHVTKLEGSATCLRNGVAIILNNGDNVEKGDVVQTGTHATLGITFIDGTVFGLLSNSRMVLNEMVYDPNGSNNSSLLSLVAGTITFVAGETAKHGDMKVDTPVATMGIRGTAVLTEIDFQIPLPPVDTDLNLSALPPPVLKCQVLVEPDGTTGSYILYDKVTLTQYAVVDKAGQQVNISSGQVNYSSEPLPPDVQKLIQDVFSLKFSDSSNTKTTVVQNDSIVPNGLSGLHSPDGSVQLPTFANLNNGTNGNGLQNNLTSTFFVPFQVNATTATENTTITTTGGFGDSLAWQVSKDGQTGWVTVSTAQNFTPSEDQEGMFLQLVVTGATPQTIGFGVVQENPAENAAISLSGLNASHNAVEGATVTATVTEPDAPSSDLITYTWLVDGKVVASGAGMNTFTPGDSAGGKTLTVTVSFIDTHNFAETGTTSAGTVVPIASVPVVTASVAPTNENSTSTLALTLTNASALFADGDDSVTITVTLDQGAKLTQTGTGAKVVDNGDGTFTVTATSTADLAGLAIVPSGEFEGTVNVGVSAVAHDGSSTSIAGTTSATLTVNPVADQPVVTASAATINENGSSTLTLGLTNAAALFEDTTDDSVTITVTLDHGATLTSSGPTVTDLGGGKFQLTVTNASQLTGLTVTPPSEFEGTVHIGVSAVASDGSSTSIAGTTSAALTVNPVAEPASLAGTITSVSGDSDTFIPLTIVVTPVDADDQISIKITGVPSDAKLTNAQGQAYQANADGSYTLTLAQLSGLKFLADEEDQTVLHVVVTSSEDGVSATSSVDIAVSVDSVLTIAAGDTLHINGDTLTDHTVNVFGTLIGFGTVTGSGSPPSLDNINIGPQGLIEASSSHTVILHGNVTGTDNGNSTLELTNNTSMEIGGSVASNVKVLFDIGQGAIGTLILDDPKDFHATITGSGTGNLITSSDIIDLKGLAYSGSPITLDSSHLSATVGAESISLSMNPTQTVITVSENGTMAMIKLAGDYTSHSFTFSSDGHLGTQFTDPLAIYSGGSLELSSASTDTVLFVNDSTISGTLVLDNPAGFTGQISGFTGTSATSDAIDLKGLAFDSAMQWVYTENSAGTGGSLTISEGSTTVDTLNFAGNYTTANFNVQSDGNGGTLVTDPPAKNGGAVSAVIMNDPGPSTNDTVVASAPNQTLTGLAASDTFVFNFAGVGNTTVTDFHPLTDILQFRSSLFATAQEILNATHDDGHGNTVIAVDGHDTVTLDGVVKAQLHTSDFHIA